MLKNVDEIPICMLKEIFSNNSLNYDKHFWDMFCVYFSTHYFGTLLLLFDI